MINSRLLVLSFSLFLIFSCKSIEKHVNEGNYERAVELALKKTKGHKFIQEKHIKAAEVAFEQIKARNLSNIHRLQKRGSIQDLERIISIGYSLRRIQNMIKGRLPIRSKNGYFGKFDFIDTDNILSHTKYELIEKLYVSGNNYLDQYKNSKNKRYAREAFALFDRILDFDQNYKDVHELLITSRDSGMTIVEMRIVYDADQFMRYADIQYMEFLDKMRSDHSWIRYVNTSENISKVDLKGVLRINRISISAEKEEINNFEESKEVADGFNYVLDDNGNVKKDSLGNDIKVEKFKMIYAQVQEVYRSKDVSVSGFVEIYADNNSLLLSDRVYADASFEDRSFNFSGDRNALSRRVRKNLRNPNGFPPHHDLIFTATDELKQAFKKYVADYTERQYFEH